MKKVTVKKQVEAIIEKDITIFETEDGNQYKTEKAAKDHEELKKEFPKLSEYAFTWLEGLDLTETFEGAREAFKSNKVVLLCTHSGGDEPFFEVVEPGLSAVKAVIKILHRRTVGCGCNMYVNGVVYKGESLCFDDEKKDDGSYYTTGKGRNIKEVLK